jgi:asparagine synthase (glutamine-hydrolysing)
MCGITGIYHPYGFNAAENRLMIKGMVDHLNHRGPDDWGEWVDGEAGIALGHKRLSIIDVSSKGHQPMISKSGRYVLIFNGEIYNHLSLRKELESLSIVHWRGHSDTETLLFCVEQWGIEKVLKKTVGMFAIALWDRQEGLLTLARDRMGEKPLYYGWQDGTLLFGSELKALKAHPSFRNEIDTNVLTLYLRHNYIPAPYSIYKDIFKLLPGTFLQISEQRNKGDLPQPIQFWSLKHVAERGLIDPFIGSDAEAITELESCLNQAVSLQRIADVPLGGFLSGGVDSSMIVALMQAQSNRPVKTFTIGFNESIYNEAEHGKAVAQHLGTDHTELYVTPRKAMEVISKLPTLYDEPFGDSSQIPMFLVAQLTKKHVTVALSGDGGDEIFGGYDRYKRTQIIRTLQQKIPPSIRKVIIAMICRLPKGGIDYISSLLFPVRDQIPLSERMQRLSKLLSLESMELFYRASISHWKDPGNMIKNGVEPPTIFTDSKQQLNQGNIYDHMMYNDAVSYLPDDILTKVDRAGMGVSLETRIPLLDHRLLEFAWRLPLEKKIRNDESKWILRQVLYKYVPKSLIERPKMGFGVPVDQWVRGPLKDWAESLLSERSLIETNFFNVKQIRKCWIEHLSGKYNHRDAIWGILMFQQWYTHNLR